MSTVRTDPPANDREPAHNGVVFDVSAARLFFTLKREERDGDGGKAAPLWITRQSTS